MQISKVLRVVYFELKCMLLQTGLTDLEKKTYQALEILLRVNCFHIFRISQFSRYLNIISSTS